MKQRRKLVKKSGPLDEIKTTPRTRPNSETSQAPKQDKWASFNQRLIWTLVLIGGFALILAAGHFYSGLLVMAIMITSYQEILGLKRNVGKDRRMPLFLVQRYYWLAVTIFGSLYGYMLPLAEIFFKTPPQWMYWVVKNHTLCTYMGALLGFMFFVFSLRRNMIRYQFAQLALLLLTCLIVVGQGTAQIKNVSSGLIWFIVPSTAVIANDISAYLFGKAFGRTKLIPRISPKKTVEGFLGASVITFVWTLLLTEILSRSKVAVCPEERLTIRPFAMWTESNCSIPEVFQFKYSSTPSFLQAVGLPEQLLYRPAWFHMLILAAFASFVAPLGGFLASAFKRALDVKDFADYIPGHGGVTDRFDCQLMMGMFTFVYLRSFVLAKKGLPTLSRVLRMSQEERVGFFGLLAGELATLLTPTQYGEVRDAFCSHPLKPYDPIGLLLD